MSKLEEYIANLNSEMRDINSLVKKHEYHRNAAIYDFYKNSEKMYLIELVNKDIQHDGFNVQANITYSYIAADCPNEALEEMNPDDYFFINRNELTVLFGGLGIDVYYDNRGLCKVARYD